MTEITFEPSMKNYVLKKAIGAELWTKRQAKRMKDAICNEEGQGTVEYAILVGVLAVIAMLAIAAFKPYLASLWNTITSELKTMTNTNNLS